MDRRILVINPNSSQAVTDGVSAALEPLRIPNSPRIDCVTLTDGPPAIESEDDVASVVGPLCQYITDPENRASAHVIACYSDPGLRVVREASRQPVFGIAESAMLTAITRGERFGVISILETAVLRHARYVRAMGLIKHFAGDRSVGLGVMQLVDEEGVLARLVKVGVALRDEDGADVLIMGCAGMARYRSSLESSIGLPVVEPTQAAVSHAISAVSVIQRV